MRIQYSRTTRRAFATGGGLALAALGIPAFAQGTPEASPAASPVASPVADGVRTVASAMGDIEVPANPQRVVVLDGPVLDACFALGITPVGATTGVVDAPWPEYLGDGTEGITNVGDIAEPNLEKIAALQPDLIVSLQLRHEEIYPQLSGIAPTVLSPFGASDWREGFLVFADALNRNEAAPAIVEAYDLKVSSLATDLGEALDTTTVSVIRVLSDMVRSYQSSSFSGTVLGTVGLPRPESQQGMEDTWLEQSMETLNQVDASVIFVTLWSGATTEDLDKLMTNPLWGTLEAVKNNKVYLVPDEYWMTAIGYLAANLILEDLHTYLVEGAPPAAIG